MRMRIFEKRKEKGLTLEKLSEKTNISISALNNYENGLRNITINQLELIAKTLGCRISDLYESDYK